MAYRKQIYMHKKKIEDIALPVPVYSSTKYKLKEASLHL